MGVDSDQRTYDLLHLIDSNEPIGSIRLVELMQRRGYSIKGRTIRLMLSDLDESELTTKVPGKGRQLTEKGQAELKRGNVSGRLERVRERISILTSQVTYDPGEDTGAIIAGTASVPKSSVPAALDALSALDQSPLGPVRTAVAVEDNHVRFAFPSSITLDGVLLSRGINADLKTAGLVEYRATETGGDVVRYIDAINGEGSTMDMVSLLIEAERTNVDNALDGEMGVLIVDNREFPLTRFSETQDLALETTALLGGVLDIRRSREAGPFPFGSPGWDFASLTYGGVGELALALLFERSLLAEWNTLDDLMPRSEFESIPGAEATIEKTETSSVNG
jgi:repressor of nif and glnA expression